SSPDCDTHPALPFGCVNRPVLGLRSRMATALDSKLPAYMFRPFGRAVAAASPSNPRPFSQLPPLPSLVMQLDLPGSSRSTPVRAFREKAATASELPSPLEFTPPPNS